MTDQATPASTEPHSTAGAWLGLAVAVRAALCVTSGLAGLVVTGIVPLLADWIGRNAEANEVPAEVARTFDLLFELAAIFEPYVRLAGGSAIGIGLLLFAASVGLIAGIESWRRAARALLVADVVHSIAASVWLAVLWFGPLGEWNARYMKAVSELVEAAPSAGQRVPVDLQASTLVNLVSLGASLAFSVAIAGVLCWLAGRPFARRWCEARGGGWTVASGTGPR